MKQKFMALRITVGVVAVYHLATGLILNAPAGFLSAALTRWLGATRTPDPETLFPIRMLGTYMLVFGVAMALTAWNPVKNRALLTVGAILAVLRALQRLCESRDLGLALGIADSMNAMTMVLLLVFAVALVGFRLQVLKHPSDRD